MKYTSAFLLTLLFLLSLPTQTTGHTTRICHVATGQSVTFYACSYHDLNESPVTNGGLLVDGVRYNFAQVSNYNASTFPNISCVDCGDGNLINRCQTVVVNGLSNGLHTVSTTCDTIFECPYCVLPRVNITSITVDPCLNDQEAPRLICDTSVNLTVDENCTATMPNLNGNVFACDRCSGVSFNQSVQVGTTLALGSQVVVFTATDASGNVARCRITVNVLDNTPPSVSMTASPSLLWPPNNKMNNITVNVSFTDNCRPGLNSNVNITNVVVDDLGGNGSTSEDWVIVNRTFVQLRAKRFGQGNGRTYIIVGTAFDNSGNIGQGQTLVSVPHNQ